MNSYIFALGFLFLGVFVVHVWTVDHRKLYLMHMDKMDREMMKKWKPEDDILP